MLDLPFLEMLYVLGKGVIVWLVVLTTTGITMSMILNLIVNSMIDYRSRINELAAEVYKSWEH